MEVAGILLGHVAEGLKRGDRFYIPRKHTVITGMTEYGKTTALETLLHNMPSDVKSLVFLTKRGERRFRTEDVNSVPPFFKPRYDWEYVRTLLESTMHEKMKFETPWIYNVCKQAEIEIKKNSIPAEEGIFIVRKLLGHMVSDERAKDFDKNINTLLIAYMDKFLPVLKANQKTFSQKLILKPGLNVMDLSPWYSNDSVQMVIIRACMEEILDNGENTALGLPEAWKTLPQGRNTPVKLLFEKYIREGATNRNYLYIDAQDLGGVDKIHLRQCDVWILGHMKEANEVKRILQQTLGVEIKPKVVQMLPLGHFLVAAEDKVTMVYVWAHGIPEKMSIQVAKGELSAEIVKNLLRIKEIKDQNDAKKRFVDAEKLEQLEPSLELEKRIDALSKRVDTVDVKLESLIRTPEQEKMLEELLAKAKDILSIGEGTFVNGNQQVALGKGIVKVKVKPFELKAEFTTEDMQGKLMFLAKEGFFNAWRGGAEINKQLAEAHAWTPIRVKVYKALEQLIDKGFLGKRKTDRVQYKLADFVTFEE